MSYMYFYIQALVCELEYYEKQKEKELSQSQHESLTKALMAQLDARDQEGHVGGQFRGPVPDHQDYQKLREEVSQYCYDVARTCFSSYY